MKPVREWMRDRRVAGVLAGVAILFVGYRFIGSGNGSAPAVPGTAVAPSVLATVRDVAQSPGISSPLPASVSASFAPGWAGPAWSWNRNPFLARNVETVPAGRSRWNGNGEAPSPAGGEGASPELRGTVVSGDASMAIFRSDRPDGGNRLVPVGGAVGEWTLLRVEPYRVSLRRGKETRVLELYKQ